jgi:hypothetical protein
MPNTFRLGQAGATSVRGARFVLAVKTIPTVLRSITRIRFGFPDGEVISKAPGRTLRRVGGILAALTGMALGAPAHGQDWDKVSEQPKIVQLSAKHTSVTTGDSVEFSVQVNGDYVKLDRVLVVAGQEPVPFSGTSVSVPFNSAGDYSVFVALGTNVRKGVTFVPRLRSRAIPVQVKDPIPITPTPAPKPIRYEVTLQPSKANPRVDESVDFTATLTPPSKRMAYRFVFDGDDSSARTDFKRAITHPFAEAGKHTVYVEVGNAKTADNGGGLEVLARSAPVQIDVQAPPRLLLEPAETRIRADETATFTVVRADKSAVDDFTIVPDETGARYTRLKGNRFTVRANGSAILHPSVVAGSQQATALLVVDAVPAATPVQEPPQSSEPENKTERDWKWWIFAGIAAVFAGVNVAQIVRRVRWFKPGAEISTRLRPDPDPAVKPGRQPPAVSFSVRVVRKGGRSAVRATRGKLVQFQRRSHD